MVERVHLWHAVLLPGLLPSATVHHVRRHRRISWVVDLVSPSQIWLRVALFRLFRSLQPEAQRPCVPGTSKELIRPPGQHHRRFSSARSAVSPLHHRGNIREQQQQHHHHQTSLCIITTSHPHATHLHPPKFDHVYHRHFPHVLRPMLVAASRYQQHHQPGSANSSRDSFASAISTPRSTLLLNITLETTISTWSSI